MLHISFYICTSTSFVFVRNSAAFKHLKYLIYKGNLSYCLLSFYTVTELSLYSSQWMNLGYSLCAGLLI